MRTKVIVGALITMASVAAPLQAQRIEAGISVHNGPIAGHVIVNDGYSSYTGEPVVHYRPVRRVVVERYPPRVIVVERFRHKGHGKHWRKHGYRAVTVYEINGRYYDRYRSGMREIVVYERDGRYFRDWRDGDRDYDRDHDRYRDRRDWDD